MELSQGEAAVSGVRVPNLARRWGYRYEKFHRTAQARASAGVAAAGGTRPLADLHGAPDYVATSRGS
jgi:hypothetical protein